MKIGLGNDVCCLCGGEDGVGEELFDQICVVSCQEPHEGIMNLIFYSQRNLLYLSVFFIDF